MKLRNPFPQEVKLLYLYRYDCDLCGSNQMLELHHIVGRSSNSAFNASLLCHKCHGGMSHHVEEETRLYEANRRQLQRIGYVATDKDLQFLKDNPHLDGKAKKATRKGYTAGGV